MININVKSNKKQMLVDLAFPQNRRMLKRVGKLVKQAITPLTKITRPRAWSPSEVSLLVRLYKTKSKEECAKILGRCEGSVRNKLFELRILKENHHPKRVREPEEVLDVTKIDLFLGLMSFIAKNIFKPTRRGDGLQGILSALKAGA
jgi:hypothetical protein